MTSQDRCRVFIGSSSEGKEVARALQTQLLADCTPTLWSDGVFEPGGYTLDSLITEAHGSDFAVLVATGDDLSESRGESAHVPRDNVVLEFGLFAGVLGRERTYVLATPKLRMPSDLLGLTRLAYHDKENLTIAVAQAAEQVRARIRKLGGRSQGRRSDAGRVDGEILKKELSELFDDAQAQGWQVRDSVTSVRLTSPKGRTYTLSKSNAPRTRLDLRTFARRLRADGLRVDGAIRRAPEDSPFE